MRKHGHGRTPRDPVQRRDNRRRGGRDCVVVVLMVLGVKLEASAHVILHQHQEWLSEVHNTNLDALRDHWTTHLGHCTQHV